MRKLALIMMTGALAAGCDIQKTPAANDSQAIAASPTDPDQIVAAVEDSWKSGSAEAAMSHYAPDAVVFSTGTLAPTRDRNIVTRDTGSFMAMKPADFTVADRNTQKLDDDTIVSSGVVSFTAQVGAARPLMRARFTQVFQRQPDGRWLIVHEHMSLPPAGSALP